jgi:hypothetical protein
MLSTLTADDDSAHRRVSRSEATQIFQAGLDRADHLVDTFFAAIEIAGVSYPLAELALIRALGALISANAQDDDDRARALSSATRAIATSAESASLIAKYGHRLRPTKSRIN